MPFIRALHFLPLFMLVNSSSTFAWDAPWKEGRHRPGSNTAPWVSSARQEARTNFFKDLNELGTSRTESSSSIDPSEVVADRRAEFESEVRDLNSVEENKTPVVAKSDPRPPSILKSRASPEKDLKAPQMSEIPWAEIRKENRGQSFHRGLVWPVVGGRMNSGFGVRGGKLHEGLDIKAANESPIRAVANGRVVFSGVIRGYGNTVVIYHGDGVSSVYAHNSRNLVAVGDQVRQREIVAHLGQTGDATAPHLHFEIRKDGNAVNPLQYPFTGSPMLAAIR